MLHFQRNIRCSKSSTRSASACKALFAEWLQEMASFGESDMLGIALNSGSDQGDFDIMKIAPPTEPRRRQNAV